MKFNIHHIPAFTNMLRSWESCVLFLAAQRGDIEYRKKWEYYKDTLL